MTLQEHMTPQERKNFEAIRDNVHGEMTPQEAIHLERLCRIMGTFDLASGHADTMDEALDSLETELRDVLGHYREAFKNINTQCKNCLNLEAQNTELDAKLAELEQETTRKPLTDKAIDALMPYCNNEFDLAEFRQFARAIEQAHGIGEKE